MTGLTAVTTYLNYRYLQEIGQDAELVNLDLKERQHKTEQFMQVWEAPEAA
jgi:hypothetical protein